MDEQPQRRRRSKFRSDRPLKDVTVGRRFCGVPEGEGRWQRLPHLGVLWTDDKEALQLGWLDNADQDAANALACRMVLMAADGVSATAAFDMIVSENRNYLVIQGNLANRGEDNFWN